MNVTRRALFGGTAMALAVASLQGCSELTNIISQTPQWLQDMNLIANDLDKMFPDIATLVGVSADTVTKIQTYISEAETLASQAATALSAGFSTTAIVQAFGGAVTAIAGLIPGGSTLGLIVQAVLSLLPSILGAVGIRSGVLRGAMSPDMARDILQHYLKD